MKKRIIFYGKVLKYVKPFVGVILVSLILKSFLPAISTINQFVSGKIVDSLYVSDFSGVKIFVILYICLILIKTIISRIAGVYWIKHVGFKFINYVLRHSAEKAFGISLGQLRQEHSGFKQDVLRSGSTSIENLNQMVIEESVPLFTTILFALIGLFYINHNLAFIAGAFFVIYYFISSFVNRKFHGPLKDLIKMRIEMNKTLLDILKNIFLLKFSNQLSKTSKHLKDVQTKQENIGIKMWVKYNLMHISSDVVLIAYFASSILYTTHLIGAGIITVGMFLPVMSWIFAVQNSISEFRGYQRRIMIAESDVEKMFEMLEQKSDVVNDPNARAIRSLDRKIVFEGVYFDYADGKQGALKNINFEVKRGEKIALVGRSGSGKTTVMSLLLRLYDPAEGAITIDGVDLRNIELSDWHNMIGYVSQEGDVMDVSIRENIMFGTHRKVTEKELDFVLTKAGIKEFIHHLPNGIDTKVGENGVKLSGGQKQRVCIARALIKDSQILLLDEATSSLDSETEHIVNKAVWEMLGDKTGVVIAHRLSTILDADKIVVMDHGEIIGVGNHAQLLKSTPYYKKLVDAQNISL